MYDLADAALDSRMSDRPLDADLVGASGLLESFSSAAFDDLS